ncbi:MAG: hypothetical protein KA604_04325, partial [Candidatus Saccharimonas sp.]|nr:hypothetical protein [Candidatus Saccharimonas sp.]
TIAQCFLPQLHRFWVRNWGKFVIEKNFLHIIYSISYNVPTMNPGGSSTRDMSGRDRPLAKQT